MSILSAGPRLPLEEQGIVEVREKAPGFRGMFAAAPISQGAVILDDWHGRFYEGMAGWRTFTVSEIRRLPEPTRSLVIRYGLDVNFDRIAGPMSAEAVTTADNFINHSCEPNMGYDFDGNVIADRDIAAGEELTIDYGCFAVNLDEDWACACGGRACRGRIRPTDWQTLAERRGFALPRFLHPVIKRRNRGKQMQA